MSAKQSKALVFRYFDEIINKGDVDVVDEIISPSFVYPGAEPGREGFKELVVEFREAFPDAHAAIDEMICEKDRVVVKSTMRATHKGRLLDIAPTHNPVEYSGIDIFRVSDQRIIEVVFVRDHYRLMQQLGVVPPLGQSREN